MTLQKKQEILRKHILCCEDDEILLRHLHDELEYAYPNSLIIICENGLQAIKQLEIVDFDLIISDYDMKVAGGDGLSLFEYTEKMGIETPFIIFSGHSQSTFKKIKSSRFYYLEKGINGLDEVITMASRYL